MQLFFHERSVIVQQCIDVNVWKTSMKVLRQHVLLCVMWEKLFICWILSHSWGISVIRISQEGFCMQVDMNSNNNYSNKNNYQQSSAHF